MKTMINLIGSGIICYSLVLVFFYFFQEKLLFFPVGKPFGDCPGMHHRGAKVERIGDVRYYVREKSDPDAWIVIFHGNAGNACDRTYFLDLLKDVNANQVVFEYPGYGKDVHAPGETVFLGQALELVLHIKKNDPKNLPVYLMGESLGTGPATFTASQTDISGLILISAYPSIAAVGQHHYPWLPVKLLMKHKFPAHIWARQAAAPVLLFHGVNDDIIPIQFGREQYGNFQHDKQMIEIPDCGHNDMIDAGGNVLRENIVRFIAKP